MKLQYVAIDERGREVTGSLDEADPTSAAASLRSMGLFPVEIDPDSEATSAPTRSLGFGIVRAADVVLFCSQLAMMLRCGLTLLQALESLADRATRPRLREAATRMADAIQSGAPLSAALEEESLFPVVVAHLVRTAEATGELDQALERAAEHLERRAALRMQVVTSLTYPAIVLLVSVAVFWFLTTSVIPKLARFLAGRQTSLPTSTRLLLDASQFLHGYGPIILGFFVGSGAALYLIRRTPRGRRRIDRALLALPLVGGVVSTAAMSHLSRTLAMLLRSGLPLLESLRCLSGTFQNRCYVETVERAAESIVAGRDLASSLEGPGVSSLTTRVLGVGEQSGALTEVLEELARFHEQRLQHRLKTLANLVEPALLLIVGGMVGLVYLAFFQAIFQLASR